MPTTTAYFDASDDAVSDPNGVWSNDANLFDSSTTTYASTNQNGSTSSNYLFAGGTSASGSGTITQVRARIRGLSYPSTLYAAIYTDGLGELLGTPTRYGASAGYGDYVTLSTPTGGWSWAVVAALEVKVYKATGSDTSLAHYIELEITYTTEVALAGASAGVAAVSGAARCAWRLVGNSAGVSTVAGVLYWAVPLAGASAGIASAEALARPIRGLGGASTGIAATGGGISLVRSLAGLSDGRAAVTGEMRKVFLLAGASHGEATLSASLRVPIVLVGASHGEATVEGLVAFLRLLAGASYGVGAVAGMARKRPALMDILIVELEGVG